MNQLMATEKGVESTCGGAAVERVGADYEAYLDGEHQGEHDSVCGGCARAAGAHRGEQAHCGWAGGDVRGGAPDLA